MSKILSIGAGVMGTAITVPAVSNGHEAKLVGTNFDEDIINSINKNSSHPRSHCMSLRCPKMNIKYNHSHTYTVK